ncbi:triphosphoribosyl-dephospho-CoA synthase [Haladaptatus sp. DYSN1]|uniref:triphosphoribosyl-dephospho-CoA synthase n=1 Tax=unclassified Haladaptatus TaxID=2622732 RepID=UPI002406F2CC|nr:triphosphoribosyl-dephospho-CoA synthase [Haladaptatus sp. DYSN1]
MRTPAQNAELALLLEVASTPKPGNVDRHRDHADLRFEHFLAGAVGAQNGLQLAAAGEPLGHAFERAVAGMAEQRGGNTQFGALHLLVPLVRTATGEFSPAAAKRLVRDTTVEDAANFYRAFEHVDVFVSDPPADADDLDVRRGRRAIPTLEARELTLYDIMKMSAPTDGVAKEWTTGFERSFAGAERLRRLDGPVTDRAAQVFLELLADEPDTFVEKHHGREVAEEASESAQAYLRRKADPEKLADQFVKEGINPGTTADIVAAALFIALERGVKV